MKCPNPGSDAAVALGCTCPTMDNGYGHGYMGDPDIFVYREDCPVHQFANPDELDQEETK